MVPDIDRGAAFLDAGAEATLSLNLAAGEYRVVCTVPGHADLGMLGKPIVA